MHPVYRLRFENPAIDPSIPPLWSHDPKQVNIFPVCAQLYYIIFKRVILYERYVYKQKDRQVLCFCAKIVTITIVITTVGRDMLRNLYGFHLLARVGRRNIRQFVYSWMTFALFGGRESKAKGFSENFVLQAQHRGTF